MSGPTLFGSNGKEVFTPANPAIVQLANGADPTTGVLKIKIDSTDIQIPIQIQSRLNSLSQQHNNVLVPPNSWVTASTWVDCSKFDKIGVTLLNDANVASTVNILWSHDQSTAHGEEPILPSAVSLRRSVTTDVKAQWAKITVLNGDTVTAHTLNTWMFLKS